MQVDWSDQSQFLVLGSQETLGLECLVVKGVGVALTSLCGCYQITVHMYQKELCRQQLFISAAMCVVGKTFLF